MPKLLLEDCQGEFITDRSRIKCDESLKESTGTTNFFASIPGRLSVAGVVNGNGRRYKRSVWENNLKENSLLITSIKRNAAFGLLEHPADGRVDLRSPISHLVVEAHLEGNEVFGEIRLVNTPEGRKMWALIEAGYNPLVSSRGFGTLSKADDGVDEVQDDYVCEGWDLVMTPSFSQAQLTPKRGASESLKEDEAPRPATGDTGVGTAAVPPPIATDKAPSVADIKAWEDGKMDGEKEKEFLKGLVSSGIINHLNPAYQTRAKQLGLMESFRPQAENGTKSAQQCGTPSTPKQHKGDNKMDANSIRESIEAFRSTDPAKLTPTRFAEGLSRLGALHQDVAKYQAEDAARSWDATQLHEAIKEVETAWNTAAQAPSKAAKKLEEQRAKLMTVVKAVADTGLSYKNKLSESLRRKDYVEGLLESVTKRGRQWRSRCEAQEQHAEEIKRRYDIACEALQKLAGMYKENITALGKRIIELEFPTESKQPAIAEALAAAKVPADIKKIRESIAPVKENAEKDEAKAEKEEAKAEKAEKEAEKAEKEAEKAEKAAEKDEKKAEKEMCESKKEIVTEAHLDGFRKSSETISIVENFADSRSASNAVAMVRRMSEASAK